MKAGKEHRVPLSNAALAQLDEESAPERKKSGPSLASQDSSTSIARMIFPKSRSE
jgi:hypothetical protein